MACPVEANTLIVSRMNTPEKVGASGFCPVDLPNLFLPDRLWRVKLAESTDTHLVYTVLASDPYRECLRGMASGTSGSMHNIPQGSFERLALSLPGKPAEQRRIGELFSRLDSLIALHQREHVSEQSAALISSFFHHPMSARTTDALDATRLTELLYQALDLAGGKARLD